MGEYTFHDAKHAVLTHIQDVFEEMEQEMAMSHQEKYALLEDVLESATDADELKIAFLQWYNDHADDVDFEQAPHEIWTHALARLEEE